MAPNSSSLVELEASEKTRLLSPPNIVLAIGCAVLVVPTMVQVATQAWTQEQGGHGPLVLATGLWAIWRELKGKGIALRPGKLSVSLPIFASVLALFVVTRATGILEIEDFAMYGMLITGVYILFGGPLLRVLWFPLVYLAFALPPPPSVVAFVTQPAKIAISSWAVSVLHFIGYPIASSGVTIDIGQYQLLVAAACSGLNSIITLTALCLFYVYLRHHSDPVAFGVIAIAAIPIAVVSNFIRVLALVLITYHFGDAVAQGFVHEFAGLLMFSVALLTVFAVGELVSAFTANRRKLDTQ